MPRSGSGSYTLPTGNPVVSGTTIEASWANNTLNDVASTLSDSLSRSGQGGMTAAFRAADGSSSVPGVAWSSETGTGFYRAGTGDTRLVVSTTEVQKWLSTGTAVTGTLSATGDAGVGTTPSVWGGAGRGAIDLGTGGAVMASTSIGTSTSYNAYYNGTNWLYKISSTGATRYTSTSIGHEWFVAPSGTAGNAISFTQAMTMDASGNLGIGTSSPGAKLQVYGTAKVGEGAASNTAKLMVNTVSGVSAGIQLFQDSNESWIIQNPASTTALTFANSGSERMRLDGLGNLGIGTASPGVKLDVAGAIRGTNVYVSSAGSLGVYNADGTNNYSLSNTSATGAATGILQFTQSGAGERMRLDASGNLGLGVTPSNAYTPGKVLQIVSGGVTLYGSSTTTSLSNNINIDVSGNSLYQLTQAASRYQQDGGSHKWYTAPSGTAGDPITFTQAMTLDASSRLLVGTTTIGLGNNGNTVLTLGNGTDTVYSSIKGSTVELYSAVNATEGYIGTYTNHPFLFYINNIERSRITSGGDLLVGTTSASGKFVSSTSANTTYSGWFESSASSGALRGVQVKYSGQSPNDAGNIMFLCADSTASRMYVNSNGGIGNYQANDVNLSDRREKTNFAPAKDYLDTICAIPVQTFNYIDQSPDDPGLTLGVVAQDVQAVAPELVMESNWGTAEDPKMRLSIYQTDLQYALMKCIQEQQALITDLRARVAALEAA